ncbi:MAG: hypothetical protein AB7S38_28710 [Vulcanimicrobiota bacterium]
MSDVVLEAQAALHSALETVQIAMERLRSFQRVVLPGHNRPN